MSTIPYSKTTLRKRKNKSKGWLRVNYLYSAQRKDGGEFFCPKAKLAKKNRSGAHVVSYPSKVTTFSDKQVGPIVASEKVTGSAIAMWQTK